MQKLWIMAETCVQLDSVLQLSHLYPDVKSCFYSTVSSTRLIKQRFMRIVCLLFLRNRLANSSKVMCVHLILWSCAKRTFKLNNQLNEELVQMTFFLASSVSC